MLYYGDTQLDATVGQLGGAVPPAPSQPVGSTVTTVKDPTVTPIKPGTQLPYGPIVIDQPILPGTPGWPSVPPPSGGGETIVGQPPGGGCMRCGTGGSTSPNPPANIPTPAPAGTPMTTAPAAGTRYTLAGLPWWVWVLGLVALSAAFDRSRS